VLRFQYSVRAGRVEVSCDADSTQYLNALQGRYFSSESISAQTFDVGIDDLLVNLGALTLWPASDTDVHWQPELRVLVEGNLADAAVVQARLRGLEADEDALPATLGGGWCAPLTEFQERDLRKLLELNHGANFSVPGAGKTRVALAFMQARRDGGQVDRAIVVCPKSAFESWMTEVRLCFTEPAPRIVIYHGGLPPDCDLLLPCSSSTRRTA
jgi:hypothetical protein